MKYFLLFVAFAFSFQLHAQENESVKPKAKIFVRLYDHNNQKVGKGHLLYGNDSTLKLSKGHSINSFPVSEIEIIKSKHAGGHNLLISSFIGFVAGIVAISLASVVGNGIGESSFDIAFVGFLCPLAGVVVGGVAEGFRKSQTLMINRNSTQWIAARKELLNLK